MEVEVTAPMGAGVQCTLYITTKMGKARGVEWIVYLLLSTGGRAFYHKRLCTFTIQYL